jgi:hypothetical protein
VQARLVVVVAVLPTQPAAADALRGKRLYLDAARIVGSGVSCVDCHGGLPGGAFGIGRAADNPVLIATAVASVSQMAPFAGRLAAADLVDLAAYIGDPAVASPVVALATRRPGGAAGEPDRMEFGQVELGARSEAELRITNTGRIAFAITGDAELDGAAEAEYALVAADCGAGMVVEPGAGCRFVVQFRPVGEPGRRIARLRVAHDWVYGIAAVALIGTAVPVGTAPPPPPPPPPPPDSPAEGCSAGGSRGLAGLIALGGLARRARGRRER